MPSGCVADPGIALGLHSPGRRIGLNSSCHGPDHRPIIPDNLKEAKNDRNGQSPRCGNTEQSQTENHRAFPHPPARKRDRNHRYEHDCRNDQQRGAEIKLHIHAFRASVNRQDEQQLNAASQSDDRDACPARAEHLTQILHEPSDRFR